MVDDTSSGNMRFAIATRPGACLDYLSSRQESLPCMACDDQTRPHRSRDDPGAADCEYQSDEPDFGSTTVYCVERLDEHRREKQDDEQKPKRPAAPKEDEREPEPWHGPWRPVR